MRARPWAIEIGEGGPYLEGRRQTGGTIWTTNPILAQRFTTPDAARAFIVEAFTVDEQAEGLQPVNLEA